MKNNSFAEIKICDKANIVNIDPRMYGSFVEHVGKCVYGGVYAPHAANADESGFNGDIINECRDMRLPLVRYPGGSFVATWDWHECIGPKKDRKVMYNLPWNEIEPNQFGLGEMVEWAKKTGCEIMLCLNIATMSLLDNMRLLEYCNFPGGTYYSDLRISHGYKEPFNIRLWSMGNEPDGWWQINRAEADEYARISAETAKALKWMDPNIEIVACAGLGATGYDEWTVKILEKGWKYYDYVSIHSYIANKENNFCQYMAKACGLSNRLVSLTEAFDRLGARLGSDKKLNISLDEWNVWYHSIEADKNVPRGVLAPHRLEDIYNLEDALAVGEYLICMLKNAERVRVGCIAQLVNVIAPFMTNENGDVLKQITYYPYSLTCRYGRGTLMDVDISCPAFAFDGKQYPMIDCAAVRNDAENAVFMFIVNMSDTETIECRVNISATRAEITELYHDDIKAENSFAAPNNVSAAKRDAEIYDGCVLAALKPHSWNMIKVIPRNSAAH